MKTITASKPRLVTSTLAILCATFASFGHAQWNYWTGATSSDWTLGSNWSLGNPPPFGGGFTVLNGAGTAPVVQTSSALPQQLWVGDNGGNAGFLTIDDGATVTSAGAQLGRWGSAGSSITQTGGSLSTGWFEFGSFEAGSGATYTMSGGTFSADINMGVSTGALNANNFNVSGSAQVNASGFDVGANSTLSISGGEVIANNLTNSNGGGNGTVNLTGGTLRVNNNLTYTGAFSVGSSSTLNLGTGTSAFSGGLDVAGNATLGTGDNSVGTASITGGLTLQSGAIIDFSINGNLGVSDTWALTGGLNLTGSATYDLVVDAVAGSIELTDGDGLGDGLGGGGFWDIFSWSGGGGPTQAQFDNTTWNLSATENTRVVSLGTVEYFGNATSGRIYLTNFSAFAIPEPSTTMLLGMGGLVMYLRRRIRK